MCICLSLYSMYIHTLDPGSRFFPLQLDFLVVMMVMVNFVIIMFVFTKKFNYENDKFHHSRHIL